MKNDIHLENIHMRDPFIYVDRMNGRYHLFGTTSGGSMQRFEMYTSNDLELWQGPFVVFDGANHPSFWGKADYWAPEVYYVEDLKAYIMFATVRGNDRKRGTVAFISEDLMNVPFRLYSDQITPEDFTNLDGTLYYDQKTGSPKIIFCHEWLEINDGSFVQATLTKDLKTYEKDSMQILFHASEIPWSISPKFTKTTNDYISDAPYIFHNDGVEYMLYSTFGKHGYQTGYCYTKDGWKNYNHALEPLTEPNSGHAMIFTSLKGINYIIYHTDNESPKVKPTIRRLLVNGSSLQTI